MAFRAPPIQYYTPPVDRRFPKIVLVVVIVIIVIAAIIIWILLRRSWRVPCKYNIDCSGGRHCEKSTGLCRECLNSSNCPAGSSCSTGFTCIEVE